MNFLLLIQQTGKGFDVNCTIPSKTGHIYSTEKTVGEAICFILGSLSSVESRKVRNQIKLQALCLESQQLNARSELEITEERLPDKPSIFFAYENHVGKIKSLDCSENLFGLIGKLLDPAHGHEVINLNLLADVDLRCNEETQAAYSSGYSAALAKK
jgi:hypothetical protein